jgi:hypothetical protein
MFDFKDWYMDMYWKFDDLFVLSAKYLGITYHEFVLLSLCVVWPLITIALFAVSLKLWCDNRKLLTTIPSSIPRSTL